MLTENEDDFLFEEDKIDAANKRLTPEYEHQENADTFTTDIDTKVIICAGQEQVVKFNDFQRQNFELERLGMTVTTSSLVITKDKNNLIGISIGGGAPMCPCLYIVQVFDGTPAAFQGSLQSGDELLAVNSVSVKGKTKVEVAKMIQATSNHVTIHYNKLHADPKQGKSLDIILKKLKHRLVDSMSNSTADTLGLSRAILCNDSLVKRLEELEGTEVMYKGLVAHARRMLKAYYDLLQTYKSFGDIFTQISVREPQQRASEAFRIFGEFHRKLEKDGLKILKQVKPVLDDIGTYLNKAIPDTKLTVRRYTDAKFTYLSYCLKVKEMDDEEHGYAALQEPLYRVETGNYDYRLILRCRQEARSKFAKLRTDVLEKMELLESKHATDLNKQLRSLLESLAQLNRSVVERIEALPQLFPIEVDFKETDFQYKSSTLKPQEIDDEDDNPNGNIMSNVIFGEEALEQPAEIVDGLTKSQEECLLEGLEFKMERTAISTPTEEDFLKDLGLFDIDLMSPPHIIPNQPDTESATTDSQHFDLFLNQALATSAQEERDLMSDNLREMDFILQ